MKEPEISQRENTLLLLKSEDIKLLAEWMGQIILAGQPKPPLPPVNIDEERPLTQQEAIKFLGKSRQTFYSWRKKGIISAYLLSGRIYYKKAELINSLQKLG
jgi:hypothetical protein